MGRSPTAARKPAFLTRLRRDRRGNVMAMMGAALIPVAAMAGSAIDVARMYVVKVRLQQACDAGALAGRKFMLDENSTTLDSNAATKAGEFFRNNFKTGWFGTSAVTFTPTKTTDNQVAGVATVRVPMTLMKMFGMQPANMTVNCEARYDVADVDVMFVLDTTGSMACRPDESGSCAKTPETYMRPDGTTGYSYVETADSRIVALRAAVLAFYDTLASNANPSTHIRYGFVPYTSTVNVGKAIWEINPSYLRTDDVNYQTRRVVDDVDYGAATNVSQANVLRGTCVAGRFPAVGYEDATRQAVFRTRTWTPNTAGNNTGPGTCTGTDQVKVPLWRYGQASANVSQFVASHVVAGALVADPSKLNGLNGPPTDRWQGCIEERQSRPDTTFNQSDLPRDLNPDFVPDSPDTRWAPMWPQQYYGRQNTNNYVVGDRWSTVYDGRTYYLDDVFPNYGGEPSILAGGLASCGKPVRRLKEHTRAEVQGYIGASDFRALGGTYHDTGMIWGTRMISPNGIFRGDTAAWPGRNPPNRYIIFMTDGEMAPSTNNYTMYGVEQYDRRVTDGDWASQKARHNARFLAECAAARARNINIYVVALGDAITPEETACATTPAQAFFTGTSTELEARFRQIAAQIAQLRIVR